MWFKKSFDNCPTCQTKINAPIEDIEQLNELITSLKNPETFDLVKNIDLIIKYTINLDDISNMESVLEQAMPILEKLIPHKQFEKIVKNCCMQKTNCLPELSKKIVKICIDLIEKKDNTAIEFFKIIIDYNMTDALKEICEKIIPIVVTLVEKKDDAAIELFKIIINYNLTDVFKEIFEKITPIVEKGKEKYNFLAKITFGEVCWQFSPFSENSLISHALKKNNNEIIKTIIINFETNMYEQFIEMHGEELGILTLKKYSVLLKKENRDALRLGLFSHLLKKLPTTNAEIIVKELYKESINFSAETLPFALRMVYFFYVKDLCSSTIIDHKSFTLFNTISTYLGDKKFIQEMFINEMTEKLKITYLHWAAQNNMLEFAEWLLKNGEDINNLTCKDGQTALHLATTKEMQQLLVNYGADTEALNKNNEKPKLDPSVTLKK